MRAAGPARPRRRPGDLGQRVLQAERGRDQPVHRQQMRDHAGDGRTTARRGVGLEPAQPHRRMPLRVPEVLQQGVQAGGLGVVRRRPSGHGDVRRPAVQAAGQDAGAQARVQVEALRLVQQSDRLAQPAGLVGAASAGAQVLLDGGRLVRRAGGQRPGAEERFQDIVRQVEHHGPEVLQVGEVGQRKSTVLDGGAGRRYARGPGRAGSAGSARPVTRSGDLGVSVAAMLRRVVAVAAVARRARPGALVPLAVLLEPSRSAHTAPPYPGGVPASWAVESSCRPRRSRRRASSSVTPRSPAVWR